MDNQAEPETASEEIAPEEAGSDQIASKETAPQETTLEEGGQRRFGTSRHWRRRTISVGALLFSFAVLELIGDGAGTWEMAQESTLIGFFALAYIASSRRSVLVEKKEIRKTLPLWKDQFVEISSVQTGDVRRVHVPVTQEGLWLYTDPEGNVALNIGSWIENPDELKELVLEQVPSSAEVTGLGQGQEGTP